MLSDRDIENIPATSDDAAQSTPPADDTPCTVVTFDTFDTAFPVQTGSESQTRRRFMTLLVPEDGERASGAMGYVCRARNVRGEQFALKRLRNVTAGGTWDNERITAGRIAAFREEYRNQLVLSHLKGFPGLYGYGTIDGSPAILMEWVEGKTLRSVRHALETEQGPHGPRVPARTVAALGIAVLDVLSVVEHLDQRLVHRDISPNNIMLRTRELSIEQQAESGAFDVCLIDFGSSRLVDPGGGSTFTMVTDVWRNGTPEYAAPEMLTHDIPGLDELRASPSIDIYALCSVLFELYAGHTPFRVSQRTGISPYLVKKDATPELPDLRRVADAGLMNAIVAGIRPAQADRIGAAELRDRLAAWLEQQARSDGRASSESTTAPVVVGDGAAPDAAVAAARALALAAEASRGAAHWEAAEDGQTAPAATHAPVPSRPAPAPAAAPPSASMYTTPAPQPGTGAVYGGAAQPTGADRHQHAVSNAPVAAGGGRPVSRRVFTGCGVALAAGLLCAGVGWGVTQVLSGMSGTSESHDDADAPDTDDSEQQAVEPVVATDTGGALFAAQDADSKLWGFVNTDGAWIVKPTFDKEPGPFVSDLAYAFDPENGYLGYIDRTGAWVIEPTLAGAGTFVNGLAAARERTSQLWGYIDTNGTWVISQQFADAGDFFDGLAPAKQPEALADDDRVRYGQLWGYIDTAGEWAIDPQFSEAGPYTADGVAAVARTMSSWGFIDRAGNEAFSGTWNRADAFTEGLGAVMDGTTELWGYVDDRGSEVIEPRFVEIGPFSDGIAPAEDADSNLWGFIGVDGQWTAEPTFARLGSLRDGVAPACDADSSLCGLVDAEGTWVVKAQFADIAFDATALVYKDSEA
ncbi:WG repeat-containing protein [Collinsella tanakaei]|uniref:WG repeat-containing protein n=1 Tax=Collinsella tanakaei TaxID=626935 RepID=UPI0025A44C37|nr:WG repeat-containing protein [Collinsella tanakaei]MDM8300677.1 WG repeat-containing protein [Collinsella tanakaei]